MTPAPDAACNVALFVTCLVDLFRPSVGMAAVRLLEESGCTVHVPTAQTCCGQPAFNSGDRATARELGLQVLETFETFDHVVAPSGSCAGMLRKHLPELFEDDPALQVRARALAARCHELVSFLVDIRGVEGIDRGEENKLNLTLTYHDSCAGLREMGVKEQPRKLLLSCGADLVEMNEAETCCGFGGTFCVKYPDISLKMVDDKLRNVEATGAPLLVAGDMGCLMNMAGRLSRLGSDVEVRHVAELLAGELAEPPIGRKKG